MAYGIFVFNAADGSEEINAWLEVHDPDAAGGDGYTGFTYNEKDAKRFDTMVEAISFYHQQSKFKPLRGDLLPNCPLTAYTVQILRLE